MQNFVFAVMAALVVITPLVFSPKSSELFEFPKLLVIYFGASLLLPFLLLKLKEMRKTKLTFTSKLVLVSLVLFVASQVLATIFSIDKHVSLFGYYSRFNGGLFSLFAYTTIWLSAFLFLNKERAILLFKIILGAGLAVALWGLPSHFGYDFICLLVMGKLNTSCWTNDFVPQLRMFSTLGQPNWFATYLLVLIFIILYFFTTGSSLLTKKLKQYGNLSNLLLFILFSLELIWTNSRSGILAYIILVSLYFLANFLLNQAHFRKIWKTAYLWLIVVFAIISMSQLFPYAIKLLPSKPNSTASTTVTAPAPPSAITPSSQIRLIVWEGALKLAARYPLLGTGVETFAYSYYFTRPIAHNLTSEWNFVYNKAHNELLNYLATTGFTGFIAYLLMSGLFLWLGVRAYLQQEDHELRSLSIAYLCAMFAIFLMNFFGFATTVTSLFFYLLPGLLIAWISEKPPQSKAESIPNWWRELTFNQLALYFVWLLFMFIYLLNYFSADYNYARGREYKQIQDFNNAYLFTQKAIDLRSELTYLDQQAVLAANLAALSQIQKQNPQVKQLTEVAKKNNQLTLEASTKNVFYYKTRAKVFYLLSLTNIHDPQAARDYYQNAIKALEAAARLAPTDPVIPYTHASLIFDQDPVLAEELVKKALVLKPNYPEAQELLKQLQK